MFDDLFDKAYEAEGAVSLSINPQILLVILMIGSFAYIFYCLGAMALEENAKFYYEKYVFPVINCYLLGCCIGQSGYGCIFGVVDGMNDGSQKIQYTLWNIKDWYFAKYALIAAGVSILFIFVVQILLSKNFRLFIRDTLFMIALVAFGYCAGRFAMTVDGFLLKLLFLPTSALAFVCQFTWIIALFLWFLPTHVVAAMNRSREARERNTTPPVDNSRQEELEDMDAPHSVHTMPSVITGPYGHTYKLYAIHSFSAEYISTHDTSIVTIRNSDLNAAANGANTSEGYFYW